MTKLERLKMLNAEKSLEVKDGHLCITRLLSGHYNQADADWIAALANSADALLAVAEAAKDRMKALLDMRATQIYTPDEIVDEIRGRRIESEERLIQALSLMESSDGE